MTHSLRFRLAALVAAVCLLTVPGESQTGVCPGQGITYPMSGSGEAITVSSTAIGFTSATISPAGRSAAIRADCSIATDSIRYRNDGGTPTATVGVLLLSTVGNFSVCGEQDVKNIRFIRVTNDAALYCIYRSGSPN